MGATHPETNRQTERERERARGESGEEREEVRQDKYLRASTKPRKRHIGTHTMLHVTLACAFRAPTLNKDSPTLAKLGRAVVQCRSPPTSF